ncbi:MAG: hypothetical protein P4L81_06830 [Candidatus Pacebacteria bacterium]|nr:hypothetical protein [Candidatus Paceibacterota bacterium]
MLNDTVVKSIVAKALGAVWILDGLLQLQPAMFGPAFVNNILAPLLSGEPSFLRAIISLGIQAWNTDTVVTNAAAALLQLAIGILLFFPLTNRGFKVGAYISIVWGLIVWVCGEAVGLLLTGSASLYAGAPGAVLFYVLLAALLLVPEKIPAKFYPKVTAGALIVGAALQLQPLFWITSGSQQVAMASTMEAVPAFSAFPTYLSNIIAAHAVESNSILLVVPLLIGLALLFRPNRITGTFAIIFLFLSWWIGQDFGQLTSIFYNTPTDLQLSPLLALFLLPLFITTDLTEKNRNKFEITYLILATFGGMLVFGIVMYGVVVLTIQNTQQSSSPSPAPMQMHMSG